MSEWFFVWVAGILVILVWLMVFNPKQWRKLR